MGESTNDLTAQLFWKESTFEPAFCHFVMLSIPTVIHRDVMINCCSLVRDGLGETSSHDSRTLVTMFHSEGAGDFHLRLATDCGP